MNRNQEIHSFWILGLTPSQNKKGNSEQGESLFCHILSLYFIQEQTQCTDTQRDGIWPQQAPKILVAWIIRIKHRNCTGSQSIISHYILMISLGPVYLRPHFHIPALHMLTWKPCEIWIHHHMLCWTSSGNPALLTCLQQHRLYRKTAFQKKRNYGKMTNKFLGEGKNHTFFFFLKKATKREKLKQHCNSGN